MINRFNLAWLSLTYQCNSRCRWCYAASNDYSSSKNKTFDRSKEDEIINLFENLGVKRLILIGGEPTLYPNLFGLVKKIRERKIFVGMVTNGRRLEDKLFTESIKQSGLQAITFSVEGSNSEIHDYTTQINGSFNEAMRGIQNSLDVGLNVSSNSVISTLNQFDLKNIVDTLYLCGIRNMGFNIGGVCISKEENNNYNLEPSLAIKAFEEMYLYAKSKGVKVRLVTPMPKCNFSSNLLNNLNNEGVIAGGPCQVLTGNQFVLDYNGDILPCTHLTGYPMFNIFDNDKTIDVNTFIERYNLDKPSQFRKKMQRYPSNKCNKCNKGCTGGCPLFWIKFDPDKVINGF
jgi:radical SAM protein with 4Fe4S-binding SPASM domain